MASLNRNVSKKINYIYHTNYE